MDDCSCISYESAGMLAQITRDYLNGNEKLKDLYQYEPKIESFEKIIADKSKESINREVLHKALLEQYVDLKISKEVRANLSLLKEGNTFTIVTGHQLCLFTGPLYFIYKILSVVNLVEQLSEKHPDYNFVPVYWMASEDHDFEEINHTFFGGRKWEWNPNLTPNASDHFGKVGAIPTEGLDKLVDEINEYLPNGSQVDRVIELLKKAYVEQPNLTSATRYIVNELFAKQGVVCVDGDHKGLKKEFAEIVKRELVENVAFNDVTETLKSFDDYKIQVSPREINLFYMDDSIRERIVFENDKYEVLNTDLSFTKEEILEEVNLHPERFSPNVMLRPVYQEKILPNLAYIGGGAEVSYWLEMKQMFQNFEVNYPMILARNSALVLSERALKKMDQLNIDLVDVFASKEELEKKLVAADVEERLSFDNEKEQVKALYQQIEDRMVQTDETLSYSTRSALTYQIKYLESLEKKLFRAEKRKRQDIIQRIATLKDEAYPYGGLQERKTNVVQMWLEYGDDFIAKMKEQFDPLRFDLVVCTPSVFKEPVES